MVRHLDCRRRSATDRRRRLLHCASLLAFLLAPVLLLQSAGATSLHPAVLASEHDPAAADGDDTAQIHCLALNVYHESRGEPEEGQLAVAVVTLNRVGHPRYPDTICRVVWQPGQFSWTQDGRPDEPTNQEAWEDSLRLATTAHRFLRMDSVGDATHFHAVGVRPHWAKSKRLVGRLGRHVFYEMESR